jgi:hypothetical protein
MPENTNIRLNVVLLDANNMPSATLIPDLNIAHPVDSTTISIVKDLFNKLKTSTQALALIEINSEATDVISTIFTRDNYFTMKIGAVAKFTYDDLFND